VEACLSWLILEVLGVTLDNHREARFSHLQARFEKMITPNAILEVCANRGDREVKSHASR